MRASSRDYVVRREGYYMGEHTGDWVGLSDAVCFTRDEAALVECEGDDVLTYEDAECEEWERAQGEETDYQVDMAREDEG